MILDDESFKLTDIVTICHVKENQIIELVEYGILEPEGEAQEAWAFSAKNLARAQKALRLQKDLEINLAGIAMILELLDELTLLRQKMHLLGK
jgi:chaperone modulatory protein CbpM